MNTKSGREMFSQYWQGRGERGLNECSRVERDVKIEVREANGSTIKREISATKCLVCIHRLEFSLAKVLGTLRVV